MCVCVCVCVGACERASDPVNVCVCVCVCVCERERERERERESLQLFVVLLMILPHALPAVAPQLSNVTWQWCDFSLRLSVTLCVAFPSTSLWGHLLRNRHPCITI